MGRKYPIERKDMVVAVDTREQMPYLESDLGAKTERVKLEHGDYSLILPDLRKVVTVERKSLDDFVSCTYDTKSQRNRTRFEKELQCLRAYRYSLVVIEASAYEIRNQSYRSMIRPQSVEATIASWLRIAPIFFADNREIAADYVSRFLFFIAAEVVGYSADFYRQIAQSQQMRSAAR